MSTAHRPIRRSITPRPRRPDVIVRGEPLAEITIYPDVTVLTRRIGATWRSYPVSADALAQTLARVPTTSGLLPPNTLAVGQIGGKPMLVCYLPAHVATLHTPQRAYTIPLPPLLWAGCGQDYRIFALNTTDAPTVALPLCAAPLPNTYQNGGICWGTSDPRPDAAPTSMSTTAQTFFTSFFNAHVANGKSRKHPTSVLALWAALHRKKAAPYPLDDLVAVEGRTLGWLIGGGPWN